MVVDIAEVNAHLVRDDGVIIHGQTVDEFALGNQDTAQTQRAAFGCEDVVEQQRPPLLRVRVKNHVAQFLKARLETVQNGDEAIHLAIEHFVEHKRRAARQPAAFVKVHMPQAINRGARPIVHGDDVIAAQEDIHLVGIQIHGFIAKRNRVDDDKEIAAVIIQLGHVDILNRILHRQRVEAEGLLQHQPPLLFCGRLHVNPQVKEFVLHGCLQLLHR